MNEDFLMHLADILEIEELNLEDELKSYPSWDSLAALSLISLIDATFNIAVSNEDLKAVHSVGDIFKLIERKKA